MFVSLSLPLIYRSFSRTVGTTGFPTDLEIQNWFESHGFGMRRRVNPDGSDAIVHELKHMFPGTTVAAKTTLHYRDVAIRMMPASAPSEIDAETQRYCVFAGAFPENRAFIFVNRVTSGDITLNIASPELGSAARSTYSILELLLGSPFIDDKRAVQAQVKAYSRNKSTCVGNGQVVNSRNRRFFKESRVEIILMILLAILSIAMYFSASFFGSVFSTFSAADITSLAVNLFAAFCGLFFTLFVRYFLTRPLLIRWDSF